MASFKKLKTGWQYRISYKDGDKYRTKSGNGFRTKKEAEVAARKVEDKISKGERINYNPVFVSYMKEWYKVFKKGRYSSRNDKAIENAIRVASLYFKDSKIKDIDRYEYQAFINWYAENHAYATVKKVHNYTKACLQDAFNGKVIESDPTYKVSVKGNKKGKDEKLKFLNASETEKLIAEVNNGLKPTWESRYVILIALATGMRFSEILALTWEDIDFDSKTIKVNKSFDHVVTKQIKETKTFSSIRTIVVDSVTIRLLQKYKIANQKRHPIFLFIDGIGNPTISNTGCNKALRKACERAGIKTVTMHALRHTHCSLLIYKGFNIKYISKRLGHSDISITYSVYGHIIDEMEDKENGKIEKNFTELMA